MGGVARSLGLATLRFAGVIVVAVTFAFVVERLMPRVGDDPTPWLEHYVRYWTNLVDDRVAGRVLRALPWTLAMVGSATIIALVVGTIVGAWMGRAERGRFAAMAGLPVMLVASVPAFLIGMVLVAIVSQQLRLLPPALPFSPTQLWADPVEVAIDLVRHALLPVLTITLAGIGTFALTMRALVAGEAGADHQRYGESLGLRGPRRFWAWELRPALGAQLTAAGLALGLVVSGAFLVEAIFSYPGLGWVLFQAILYVDLDLARGAMLLIIVTIALITTLIDLSLPLVDPRVRR